VRRSNRGHALEVTQIRNTNTAESAKGDTMNQTTERRFLQHTVRSEPAAGKRVLAGMAARFNTLSEDLGGWRERLAPGCFKAALDSGKDIRFLADHDSAKILARTANRTLTLRETSAGLTFRAELPDTSVGNDVYVLCRDGLLDEMSFGFIAADQVWTDEADPETKTRISVRTVRVAEIFEISAVCWAAYPSTSVGVDAAARAMFPGGMPLEVRSHIPQTPPISAVEYAMRLELRNRAEKLLYGK
jgi:HK97 family phage prohead protease